MPLRGLPYTPALEPQARPLGSVWSTNSSPGDGYYSIYYSKTTDQLWRVGVFFLLFQGHKSVLSVRLKIKKSLKIRKPHLGWRSNDQWEKFLMFKALRLPPRQLGHHKTDAWAGRSTCAGGRLYHLTPRSPAWLKGSNVFCYLFSQLWSSLWSMTECQK